MFSERANDGIERGAEQWFKRYNSREPKKSVWKSTRTRCGWRFAGGHGRVKTWCINRKAP